MAGWFRLSDLKSGETIEFQPTRENAKEYCSIWDVKNKKWIKQGEYIMTEDGRQEVNKYTRLTDEEKKFFFLLLKQVVKEKIGFRNEQKALYIAVLKMSSPLCGVLNLNDGIC